MMKCIRCDEPVSGNPFFCEVHNAGGDIVAAVNAHHVRTFNVQEVEEEDVSRGRVSGRAPMDTIQSAKKIMQKRRDDGHEDTISKLVSQALSQYVTRYRHLNG